MHYKSLKRGGRKLIYRNHGSKLSKSRKRYGQTFRYVKYTGPHMYLTHSKISPRDIIAVKNLRNKSVGRKRKETYFRHENPYKIIREFLSKNLVYQPGMIWKKNCQSRILYLAKLSFIKDFPRPKKS